MSNIVTFPNKSRKPMMAEPCDGFPRWQAIVTYRSKAGPQSQTIAFEELEELHDIIEGGPSFHCIDTIVVRLNPEAAPELVDLEDQFA